MVPVPLQRLEPGKRRRRPRPVAHDVPPAHEAQGLCDGLHRSLRPDRNVSHRPEEDDPPFPSLWRLDPRAQSLTQKETHMIFDALCDIVEEHLKGLKPLLQNATLISFDHVSHRVLDKQIPMDELLSIGPG